MAFTLFAARRAMERFAELIEEKEAFLTWLDTAIGDGDHGVNMSRGLRSVLEKIRGGSYDDFGGFYRDVAMTMMDEVGGSSGPLYGTFFMRIAQQLSGKDRVGVTDLAQAMHGAVESLAALGKSEPGDKTILDSLKPAVDALADTAAAGGGSDAAWNAAAKAAEQGAEETVLMLARRGRSSYLGDKSIGHQDPGATSALYLIASFRDSLQEV